MNTLVKSVLVITLFIFGVTDVSAQWGKKVVGNGNVTTRTVNTGSYDAVKGVGPMDIHLEKGSEGNISVSAEDNLHEYVIVEVKDNTLIVRIKKNTNLRTKKGIHVTVPFQDISGVSLTGSGDIDTKDTIESDNLKIGVTGSGDVDLNVIASDLKVKVTGSGDIVLSGRTNDLEVRISGSGDFKGFDLDAQNTDASVSGSGDARVVAKSSLKARVNGSGDITYKGSPGQSDTKTSGSGDISSY